MPDRSRFHPSVTTDTVLFATLGARLRVLLVRRGRPPFEGTWALPGGFLEEDEDLDVCARRELQEETGIRGVTLEQFGAPGRDPRGRVISIAFLGTIAPDHLREPPRASSDAADLGWFDVDAPPPLAFDHAEIVSSARRRLQTRLDCDPRLAFTFLPADGFTIAELQAAYEAVRGEALDKHSFLALSAVTDLLEEAGGVRTAAAHHGQLYRPHRPTTNADR